MITLYNNPLCIFHKRPNLWWHYWQLTVASVLWFIPLCISFINQDLLKRHSWELELEFWSWPHKGVHWSSVHCLKKSWLRFSARPSLPPPSLDCFMSRRLWKTQRHCCTCRWFGHWSPQPRCQRTEHSWNLFVIFSVSKLLIIMFTNNNFKTSTYHISTGTSTKISHYHMIWPLIICSMNSANSPLPFHLANSTSEASFQFLIANTIFFLITFSFI